MWTSSNRCAASQSMTSIVQIEAHRPARQGVEPSLSLPGDEAIDGFDIEKYSAEATGMLGSLIQYSPDE